MNLSRAATAACFRALALAACAGEGAKPRGGAAAGDLVSEDVPSVAIRDDGSTTQGFSSATARRLPDGAIVVADLGSGRILLFGRDGAFVRPVSRLGDGPGELRGRFSLRVLGDTIVAMGIPPAGDRRIRLFRPTPSVVATMGAPGDAAGPLTPVDYLATGHLVVERGAGFRRLEARDLMGDRLVDSVSIGVCRRSGSTCTDVHWLPAKRRALLFAYPWSGSPGGKGFAVHPFLGRTMMLASGDLIWFVDGRTAAVVAFDGSGRERTRSDLRLPMSRPSEGAIARYEAHLLAEARVARDSARARASVAPGLFGDSLPLVDAAYPGTDGSIWLRLLRLGERGRQQLVQVARDGRLGLRASVPDGLVIQEFGTSDVLGIEKDADDVERVVRYTLKLLAR